MLFNNIVTKTSRVYLQKTGLHLKNMFLLLTALHLVETSACSRGQTPHLKTAPRTPTKVKWDFVLIHLKLPKIRWTGVITWSWPLCLLPPYRLWKNTNETTCALPLSDELKNCGLPLLWKITWLGCGGETEQQLPFCSSSVWHLSEKGIRFYNC